MDVVTILRELQHRRRSVLVALLVAVLAAVAITFKLPAFKSRAYNVGVASGQILLDTPSSQVVDIEPKGADTLGLRANLLASLMVDGAVEADIAHTAGLKPSQLGGTTDAVIDATPGSTLTAPPSSGSHPYLLTTHILSDATDDPLPIIEVDTQAPTAAGAVQLVESAVTGLRTYLNSTAAAESIPDAQRLQVTSLGVPQGATETQGPTKLISFLVLVFVFLLGCGGILAGSALRRRWDAAAERERLEAEGLLMPEPIPSSGGPTVPLPVSEVYRLGKGTPISDDPIVNSNGANGAGSPALKPKPAEGVSAGDALGERRPLTRADTRLVLRRGQIEIADRTSTRVPDVHRDGESSENDHNGIPHTTGASKRSLYQPGRQNG